MEEKPTDSLEATPEQVRYATVLEKGMYLGLLCLFATFTLYVSGVMEAYLPRHELSEHWQKNVHEYLTDAEIEPGWGWVKMLGYGDFINFIGIAILAGVTVPCYISTLPLLLRKKDTIYVVLVLLEVLVLSIAASGIVKVGH
jgi:hypothetical protein